MTLNCFCHTWQAGRQFCFRFQFFIFFFSRLANVVLFCFGDLVAYRRFEKTWVGAVVVGLLLPLFACARG